MNRHAFRMFVAASLLVAFSLATGCGETLDEPNQSSTNNIVDDGTVDEPVVETPTTTEFGSIAAQTSIGGEAVQANIYIDGEDTGRLTPCELEDITPGEHTLSFAHSQLIPYEDVTVAVESETVVTANGQMVYDLTGEWINESTNEVQELEVTTWEPDEKCPDGGLQIWGIKPLGRVCIEPDGTLSLCKTRAEGCTYGEGTVESDGNTIHFTAWNSWDDSLALDQTFRRIRH